MLTFEFIVAMHACYEILLRLNNTSKIWQSVHVHLKNVKCLYYNFCDCISELCLAGFNKSVTETHHFIEKYL